MSSEELKPAIDSGRVTACMVSGIAEHDRGASQVPNLRPKRREDGERAIQVILTPARSGGIGDGKISVMPVTDAVRIRTGERGEGVVAAHDEAATTA